MRKESVIRIVSKQRTENGDNTSEMSVVGTVTYDEDKSVIEYIENNDETGPEETTITVFKKCFEAETPKIQTQLKASLDIKNNAIFIK